MSSVSRTAIMLRQTRNFHQRMVVTTIARRGGVLPTSVSMEGLPTLYYSNTYSKSFESSHNCHLFSTTTTVGRTRKRKVSHFKLIRTQNDKSVEEVWNDTPSSSSSSSATRPTPPPPPPPITSSNNQTALPYPKGQPWRVLWPLPNGDDYSPPPRRRRIPRLQDFRRAWAEYMETWKYGLSGRRPTGINSGTTHHRSAGGDSADILSLAATTTAAAATSTHQQQLEDVADNAKRNLHLIREDAQELLEHAKNKTGIRTQEDIKNLASEMMQLATESIREFMAGYRQGRDDEIDKMLHEYFKDPSTTSDDRSSKDRQDGTSQQKMGGDDMSTAKPRKKRKPKRGIPRD
jgi:hypothetical protein